MTNHAPITLGEWSRQGQVICDDEKVKAALSVPGVVRWIADDLQNSADSIEMAIRNEERDEALGEVEDIFSMKDEEAGNSHLERRIQELELEAAEEKDPYEKVRYRHRISKLREEAKKAAAETTNASAKKLARKQALNSLDRPDRAKQRKGQLEEAIEKREAADILNSAFSDRRNAEPAQVTAFTLDRHACVFGATGGGKSRFILHLLEQQLLAGCSVLCVDPKPEAAQEILSMAIRAGLEPHEVVYVTPKTGDLSVGWNPFLIEGEKPTVAATAMHGFLQEASTLPGVNMDALLRHSLQLCAAHRLSLYEVWKVIDDPGYCSSLLSLPRPADAEGPFDLAIDFFTRKFPSWTPSARAESTRAMSVRLEKLLESDFVKNLLCARSNTLNLEELWKQRKLVLFCLDRSILSRDSQRVVGGAVAYMAALAGIRVGTQDGRRVVLSLDELGSTERFLGDELEDIVRFARSQGLRMLIASQNVSSISDKLREALLGNASMQAFFALGVNDASSIAPMFASASTREKGRKVVKLTAIPQLLHSSGGAIRYLLILNDLGMTPRPRDFLPEGLTEEQFLRTRVLPLPLPPVRPTEPPAPPEELKAVVEFVVKQVKNLVYEMDNTNARQAARDWINRGTTPVNPRKHYAIGDSDVPASQMYGVTPATHALTARIGREEREDGTVVYVIEKRLEPIDGAAPIRLAESFSRPMGLLAATNVPASPSLPKRFTPSPPPPETGFCEQFTRSVFGANSFIACLLFGLPPSEEPEIPTDIEYGYKPIAIPRRIAPYVDRLLAYHVAQENYSLQMHQYQVNAGKSYDELFKEARENLLAEYKALQSEMRTQRLAAEIERLRYERADAGSGWNGSDIVLLEGVANICTDFDITNPQVRPDLRGPLVEVSRFLSQLKEAGLQASLANGTFSKNGQGTETSYSDPELIVKIFPIAATVIDDPTPVSDSQWRYALQEIKNRHPAVRIVDKGSTNVGIIKVANVPDAFPVNSLELCKMIEATTIIHGVDRFKPATTAAVTDSVDSTPATLPKAGVRQTKSGEGDEGSEVSSSPVTRRTLDDE